MKIWDQRKRQTPLLHYFLFAYWFVLLLWQNIGGGENRSGVDLIIKCGLILMLFIYYFMHMTGLRRDVLSIIVVLMMIYGAIKLSNGMELSEALYYFFPLLFILLVYGVGWHFKISKAQLIQLCNMLIIVVAYIAIYALIFCFDQFINVFSISSAYGNELKSFLRSNHEYGMYLSFGIMVAVLCMEIDKETVKRRKGLYIAAIILFGVNLVLTFSRTSLLAFAVMFLFYVLFFAKRRLKALLCWMIVILAAVILLSATLRDFFWEIVMKENTDAGRDDLIDNAMQIFNSGDLLDKFLGRDFYYVELMLNSRHGFSSFHNAYVQQLVANGVLGAGIIVTMSLLSFYDIYLTVKSKSEHSRLAKFFIGFSASALIFMFFNTTVLYASSIDSYFLTIFAAIVPKYVNQSIRMGTFDPPKKENDSEKKLR